MRYRARGVRKRGVCFMAKEFIFACIGAAEARGTMKINEYFNLKMVRRPHTQIALLPSKCVVLVAISENIPP